MIPVAYTAEAGPRLLRVGAGHEDLGEPVEFHVESAAVAPAGVSGDCDFDRVRLVVTWSGSATLIVTSVLDGEPLKETHVLALPHAERRRSEPYELVLRRASTAGSSYSVRGTWFALRIEGHAAGPLFVEPSTLEYEVLTPTQGRSS